MRDIENCITGALQDAKRETDSFYRVDPNAPNLQELFRSAAHCAFSERLMRLPVSRIILKGRNIFYLEALMVIGVCLGGVVGASLICLAAALPIWGYLQIGIGRMMFLHRLGERPVDSLIVAALATASFFILSGGFFVWKNLERALA